MTSQTIYNEPKILTLEIWQSYIDKKKLELLTHIASRDYLENTSENIKFISIIKELVNCNLFNISNIAFYILKLLENTFIDSYILCKSASYDILNTNTKTTTTKTTKTTKTTTTKTTTNHISDSNEYLDTLNKYLHLIIDNIVYIELSLNIHFIIIINNLQKLKNLNKDNIKNLNNLTSKSFHIFEKINNDIINTIKPSSHILLFLKLIRKLGKFHMNSLNNNDILTNKNNSKTIEYNNYIKNNKDTSNKIKCVLDNFIININNFYESKDYKDNKDNKDNKNNKDIIIKCTLDTNLNNNIKNITHSITNNITNNINNICQNYIAFVVELLFKEFNNLFDLLATHLKSSDNITEAKLQNIILIKDTLSNMINIEIENIKNKLLFDK